MKQYKRNILLAVLLFLGVFLIYQCGLAQVTWREKIKEKIREKRSQRTKGKQQLIAGPGDYAFSLEHDGLTRAYKLHVPPSYKRATPAPLILAFHGGMGSSEHMAKDEHYNLISKSDREGFIVAFPNGPSKLKSGKFATWNAGDCCGYARDNNIDDVGFVKKMLQDIQSKVTIDPERIYATGMSNGAMFSYRLACELTEQFRAIASVAGTENCSPCNPSRPISILHIHAKNDTHVLFTGGAGPDAFKDVSRVTNFNSVSETISRWVSRNHCNKKPKRVLEKKGAYCDLYTGCDGNTQVKLCVTEDGGHSWPGGKKSREQADNPSDKISAIDEIWEFFESQSL